MNRRSFLGLVGGTAASASAGCAGGNGDSGTTAGGGGDPGTTAAGGDGPRRVAGVELPVPRGQLRRGALKDAIPALVDPAFGGSWEGLEIEYKSPGAAHTSGTIEPRLSPADRVIGVERGGEARAYPLRVLNRHEVVNDTFGGPLLVTFCPLCGSGVTAVRTVGGEPTTFGVSGLLWMSDLVLYDRATESLWSQIAATAIRGPRTGATLQLVPSTLTTWGEWRDAHPDTRVLLPPPESGTVRGPVAFDYTTDPYADYKRNDRVGVGQNPVPESDADLAPKAEVIGVTNEGAAKAYPLERVREAGVVNDAVNGLPVVVAVAADGETLVAYERTVDGETLEFERADERHLAAGGSEWVITTGRAVDGPHGGERLAPATELSQQFWFAWLDFHPDSGVYAG